MSRGDTPQGQLPAPSPVPAHLPCGHFQGSFCLGRQKSQAEGGSLPLILGPNLSD